ncbi:enhancer of mRNA-decapping protein 4 isoform X2 [Nymphaea colorata]|uniref:enhancer of mRNA-decapping protein 4 isoform X2 n=1 Tax=Nymphaea colorata TaxID=210225 RepID=UPI00129D2A4F|nr:enhancer of mRNA-decapping protein 4 isoform X2 [Nymphaea colorata]
MASSGNPNQSGGSGGFDVQKLFKPNNPPNPIPNPNAPPGYGAAPSAPQFPSPYSSPQLPNLPNLQPGPFSYPPQTAPYHHYMHYPPDPLQNSHPPLRPPFSNSPLPPHPVFSPQLPQPTAPHIPSSASPAPNPGARLMALLSTQTSGGDPLASAPRNIELPHPPISSEAYSQSVPVLPMMPTAPPISLAAPPPVMAPGRLPSSKLPRGRHMGGEYAVYDVDDRRPGEVQPQLEVNPITKYGSDPGLVIGRQIAVNGTYICYGLKLGAIRVLNINTALRHLLRGHSQRVTDMAFFAEDVHLLASASVDGKVFIWKITESHDEEDKPQITAKIILAMQIVGDRELFHPRVCWHTHKQEVLMVGIGNHVLRIDTLKVAKGDFISEEEPIKCPLDKPIDGVYIVGRHDGDVTDLSICQWMTSRLASASTDGTVKIWGERKSSPLFTLTPHDGQPVNSVTFLVAPQRPDHVVLLTAGPLSRELKIWSSASPEGWLLPSEVESWHCMQTLELKSSSEPQVENAFFNQVVVLPRVGLVLLANAKKNAIYAVHVEYGANPTATHMDYIAEFTVTMPILSLTGTSESISETEGIVQIYCVQTQAIQQYALDLSLCLPPPLDLTASELSVSRAFDISSSDALNPVDSPQESPVNDVELGNSRPKSPFRQDSSESASASIQAGLSGSSGVSELVIPRVGSKSNVLLSAISDGNNSCMQSPPLPLSPRLSGRLSGPRSPPKTSEQRPPAEGIGDQMVNNYMVDRKVETVHMDLPDIPSLNDNCGNEMLKENNLPAVPNSSITFNLGGSPAHLITPSEILSMTVSSENSQPAKDSKLGETVVQDVGMNNEAESVVVEVKVVGEGGVGQLEEPESKRETRILIEDKREKTFYSQASDLRRDIARECCPLPNEVFGMDGRQIEDAGVSDERELPSDVHEDEGQDPTKDAAEKATEISLGSSITQSPSVIVKGKKNKVKSSQASASSSTTASPFNSTDSLNGEPVSSSSVPAEAAYAQILAMQESLNQLITMQKEMPKQMATMVTVPISKEGKRIEAALGRNMDRIIKTNIDALWSRVLEENEKHEKVERDRLQQITSLVSSIINKDLPALLDRTLKKEIAAIGPTVTKNVISSLDKAIPSAITESFQKGFSDKAINQLEKSLTSKLETALTRQLQTQFQTSVKQVLHDGVRSTIESSLIPAFELSCKAMFEQIDSTFQKGMGEYVAAVQQQLETTHSNLSLTLRDGISSLSSAVQTLNTDIADGQRKILAFACARANPAMDPMSNSLLSNGPQVEVPLDPTKELTRLISEHKFEEAFTAALQRSDLSLVSWLCSQVDLQGILSTSPLPLSQGVLLSLVQQLACDLGNETTRKLSWVTEAAMALNPSDPMIIMHARPILEQVYQMLMRQRAVTTASGEANSIRMVIHVITSILKTCK